MLNIAKRQEGDELTIELEGMLNVQSAPDLAATANEIGDGIAHVVVDCSKLRYTSSAGLRVILALQARMDELGCTLVFKNINSVVAETFDDTGFSDILTIE